MFYKVIYMPYIRTDQLFPTKSCLDRQAQHTTAMFQEFHIKSNYVLMCAFNRQRSFSLTH